ncbi:uncharacterized protein SPSK_03772 [Sporothrix schenckii 1099-18]|uniref:Uncharacterized protein n=1 Tax=Sporothrix schenckii 1099-18 TaxID=1397361 RepID=A0A0F2LY71_SPOSC|nr:uncharacterized protein SPSK_03772 [Sporothrix schenckii 1099-18]KJR82408.1 hypothetical protein SPSK_03772 [Sporothrix schenckii 1099-18]
MVRAIRLPAAGTPAAVRRSRPEVGPLRAVGRAQQHAPCIAQTSDGQVLTRGLGTQKGQRAGRGFECRLRSGDIVLDEQWDAMERTHLFLARWAIQAS